MAPPHRSMAITARRGGSALPRHWSWRHDALVLLLAAAVVCAHVRAQDDGATVDSSSTGDDAGDASSSSTGSDNSTRHNHTAKPGYLVYPKPRPPNATAYCGLSDAAEGMRVYDNTTVCFVVGGVAKILFYVNCDEFSVAQIMPPPNASNLPNRTGPWDHPLLWFQAEYGGAVSPMKYRHPQVDNTSAYYDYAVPFWTLIINLKDGFVESLEWDDGCFGCSGDACVEDTCAVDPVAQGCTDPNSRADCSPKFFISWFGTDRNGQYLTSAGSRMSRFRQYSVSSAFGNAYQSASDAVDLEVKSNSAQFTASCTSDPTQDACVREPGT